MSQETAKIRRRVRRTLLCKEMDFAELGRQITGVRCVRGSLTAANVRHLSKLADVLAGDLDILAAELERMEGTT